MHRDGDWLLISEWKQLRALPSQPIRVWRHPFVKVYGRGGGMAPRLDFLSLQICPRPHPDRLPARNSGLFKVPIVISLLPHFILVERNCVYPSAQLSGHTSHQSSRLPASRPSYLCKCCLTCKQPGACRFSFCLSWLNPLKPKPLHTLSFKHLLSLGTWELVKEYFQFAYPLKRHLFIQVLCEHFTVSAATNM